MHSSSVKQNIDILINILKYYLLILYYNKWVPHIIFFFVSRLHLFFSLFNSYTMHPSNPFIFLSQFILDPSVINFFSLFSTFDNSLYSSLLSTLAVAIALALKYLPYWLSSLYSRRRRSTNRDEASPAEESSFTRDLDKTSDFI